MGSPPPGTSKIQNRSLFIGPPTAGTTLAKFKADFAKFRRRMEDVRDEFRANTSIDCRFVAGPWLDPKIFERLTAPTSSKNPSAPQGTRRVRAGKSTTPKGPRGSR